MAIDRLRHRACDANADIVPYGLAALGNRLQAAPVGPHPSTFAAHKALHGGAAKGEGQGVGDGGPGQF